MVTGNGSGLSVELVELVELVARVILELKVLFAVGMAGDDSWAAVMALLASASSNGIRAMRLRAPCVISLFCSSSYLRSVEGGDGCGDNGREMAHHFPLVLLVPVG